jgi:hypothetical protein
MGREVIHMPKDNILLILGRLEGKTEALKDSKNLQDARIYAAVANTDKA